MSEVAVPSKASTVVIVRPECRGGFEVLLTRRPQEMQVLGGYLVFPGGRVEETDCSEEMFSRCRGLSLVEAHRIFAGQMPAAMCLGCWVTAARELFEEAGLHFFITDGGDNPRASRQTLTERLAQKRQALAEGRITFADLLESERLFCDLSRLRYLFHRITPEKHTVRFDTRFYLAALPANQSPLTSSEEVAESLWVTPPGALSLSESGRFPMMPPTIVALRTLADIGTWRGLVSTYRLG
jgi:8-oxo-dGTP pyrophosphatase MutT (NUDIX family)